MIFLSLKNGDFIKIDYTGRFEGKLFDTTEEAVAKKENVFDEKTKYGSVTVVIGESHLLRGIDESIPGKKIGDEFKITVEPEKAFGKKNAKLLKIIPEREFKTQKIKPYPGMTLNIDNLVGNVISVGSGRVIIDFNHPLAGKILDYEVKIHEKIEDKTEQIKALLELYTNRKDFNISLEEKEVKIESQTEKNLEEHVKNHISDVIKKYIKLEKVEFIEKEKETEKETAEKTEKKTEKETKKQTAGKTEKKAGKEAVEKEAVEKEAGKETANESLEQSNNETAEEIQKE